MYFICVWYVGQCEGFVCGHREDVRGVYCGIYVCNMHVCGIVCEVCGVCVYLCGGCCVLCMCVVCVVNEGSVCIVCGGI